MALLRLLRLVGIAIGSLVAAALVLGLVLWIVPLPLGPVSGLLTLVLGGLIYSDIRRRDRPAA